MSYERTQQTAYEAAIEYLDLGYLPACVQVRTGDDDGVFTTVGMVLPPDDRETDDLDVFAAAFIAIRRAREEAEQNGLHPVHS